MILYSVIITKYLTIPIDCVKKYIFKNTKSSDVYLFMILKKYHSLWGNKIFGKFISNFMNDEFLLGIFEVLLSHSSEPV